jgi:hypothetical protein
VAPPDSRTGNSLANTSRCAGSEDRWLTVGNLKHIINGRMRQILWASGVRVKRSTLHFRSVLPMVEFMVEAKTPPTFRFLSAQCVCPCANSNLSGTRFRSYCILC